MLNCPPDIAVFPVLSRTATDDCSFIKDSDAVISDGLVVRYASAWVFSAIGVGIGMF